jgi:hypothetical protein
MADRFSLSLTFSNKKVLLLKDANALMYDLEAAHDIGVIDDQRKPDGFVLGQYFWTPNRRPIVDEKRLRVRRISLQSPLTLQVVAPYISGFLALVQVIGMVPNWGLNRRKLALDVEKGELEVRKLRRQESADIEAIRDRYARELAELDAHMDPNGAKLKIAGRLSKNPFELQQLEFNWDDDAGDYHQPRPR